MSVTNLNKPDRTRFVEPLAGVHDMAGVLPHITRDPLEPHVAMATAGFRFGDRGTHTSRTIMLTELGDLLAAVPGNAEQDAYAQAIIDENVLGKATVATRRLTYQRLRELYGLDSGLPIFRVLRRLWPVDQAGRPLLAMLCALARDPLLRSTQSTVLSLPAGAELVRGSFLASLRDAVGERLNDAVLDKVARNAASSWSQSGHLEGRVRKRRQRVDPTPGSLAMALWLGAAGGLAGRLLLDCRWSQIFDRAPLELLPVMLQAKRLDLIHARAGGEVVEIDASGLDPVKTRR